MANAVLEKARLISEGQKKAIAERHPKRYGPTKQQIISGMRGETPVVEETPLMMEGIDEASYGQVSPGVEETPETTALIEGAVPELAQVQEQEIPLAPPLVQTAAPQVEQLSELPQLPAQETFESRLESAYNQRGMGIAEENLALAEQQKQVADAQLSQANREKEANDIYAQGRQERLDSRKEDGKRLIKILQAPMQIDPDRWWNSRSTGQKLSAGIAALLSGFGGQAMSMMQNAIDRDISAQRENWKNKRESAQGIYALGKEMGLEEDAIDKFINISARRHIDLQAKAAIAKTNNPVIKARGKKLISNNSLLYLKDIASLRASQQKARAAAQQKQGKLGQEARKSIFLSSKTSGAIRRMKNSLRKGDWTRSTISNEFNVALREGTLLLGFMLSGANVAEREAGVIEKMLKGDITQSKKSLLAALTRWENAINGNIDLTLTTSGLSDNQVSSIKNSLGMTPQKKRPKTFKKLR